MKLVWVVSASCLPNVVLYHTSTFGNVNDVQYCINILIYIMSISTYVAVSSVVRSRVPLSAVSTYVCLEARRNSCNARLQRYGAREVMVQQALQASSCPSKMPSLASSAWRALQ